MGEIEEEDVTESKDARDRRIAEIATIKDPIEREQERNTLAKVLKVSRST
jgi:hypothetical protein